MVVPLFNQKTALFLFDKVRGRSMLKRYKELMKNQWLEKEEILKIQEKKLQELIRYVYRFVPYYKAMFMERGLKPDDIQTVDDLRKLPVLTKEDILEHGDKLVSVEYIGSQLTNYRTGGSTGKPIELKFNAMKFDCIKAEKLRFESFFGLSMNDRHALIWGSPQEIRKSNTMPGKIRNKIFNQLMLDAFHMNKDMMWDFANKLNEFKPFAITAYANAMYLFSDFLKKNKIKIYSPEAICTTAEMLHPFMRGKIERVFGCRVYNSYGCKEVGEVAQECEYGHMHLNADNLVVEFIKGKKKAKEGQISDIIITDLNARAMPLIRYQIEDLGSWKGGRCKCMRGLPMMNIVAGRKTDIFTLPDDSLIYGESFTNLLYDVPNIKRFRLTQDKLDHFTLELVVGDNFTKKDEASILKKIRKKTKNLVNVSVKYKRTIGKLKSGKYCFTKSKIKPKI